MLINFIVIILFIFAIWIFGTGFLKLIDKNQYNILAPIVGAGIYTILISALYFFIRISISNGRIIISIIALITGIYLCIKKYFKSNDFISLGILIILTAIMSLPGLIGGEQYYVYRGNYWDHFNFITRASAMYEYKWSLYRKDITYFNTFLHSFDTLFNQTWDPQIIEMLDNPALINGYKGLYGRLSTYTVLATLITKGYGDIFFLAYLYRMVLISLSSLPLIAFSKKIISNNLKYANLKVIIIVFSYLIGFWNQINFDIDAWAQNLHIPLIITTIFLLIKLFQNIFIDDIKDKNLSIFTIIMLIASYLVYPEGTVLYGFIYLLVLICLILFYRIKLNINKIIRFISVPLIAIILTYIINPDILMHTILQIKGSGETPDNFAIYFNSYWNGRISINNKYLKFINLIISFIGFYFLTPDYTINNKILLILWNIIILLLILIFVIYTIYQLIHILNKNSKNKNFMLVFLSFFIIASIVVIALMTLRKSYWTLGKIMIWISPIIYIFLMSSLLNINLIKNKRKFLIFIPIFIIISNLSFGFTRIVLSKMDDNKIIYYNNYPSIQDKNLKVKWLWNFNVSKVGDNNIVQVESDNWLYNIYIAEKLWYNNKQYMSTGFYQKDYFGYDTEKFNTELEPDMLVISESREHNKIKSEPLYIEKNDLILDTSIDFTEFMPYYVRTTGISGLEERGRWTDGNESEIVFLDSFIVDDLSDIAIVLNIKDVMNKQIITLEVNEQGQSIKIEAPGRYEYKFKNINEVDSIKIYISNPSSTENDSRKMGIFINSINIIEN